VLLLHASSISGWIFHGSLFETDFASLLAWRDGIITDQSVQNCFAMAAIKSADGAFLLGVMGDHTANAGKTYFPAGVTDLQSVTGTRVDLESGLWREVSEETGLERDDLVAAYSAAPSIEARCAANGTYRCRRPASRGHIRTDHVREVSRSSISRSNEASATRGFSNSTSSIFQ